VAISATLEANITGSHEVSAVLGTVGALGLADTVGAEEGVSLITAVEDRAVILSRDAGTIPALDLARSTAISRAHVGIAESRVLDAAAVIAASLRGEVVHGTAILCVALREGRSTETVDDGDREVRLLAAHPLRGLGLVAGEGRVVDQGAGVQVGADVNILSGIHASTIVAAHMTSLGAGQHQLTEIGRDLASTVRAAHRSRGGAEGVVEHRASRAGLSTETVGATHRTVTRAAVGEVVLGSADGVVGHASTVSAAHLVLGATAGKTRALRGARTISASLQSTGAVGGGTLDEALDARTNTRALDGSIGVASVLKRALRLGSSAFTVLAQEGE